MKITGNAWLSVISFLAGIWLIISPSILGYTAFNTPTSNDFIVGIIIAVLAAINFFWGSSTASWLAWIVALVGLWEVAAPFILRYSNLGTPTTNAIILGIIVIIFSGARALTMGGAMGGNYSARYGSDVNRRRRDEEDNH